MKGLLIAYSFYPSKTVGAIRSTYWYNAFLQEKDIELEVITAQTKCDLPHVTTVSPISKSVLSILIKDEGLAWMKDLKHYFKENSSLQYDFVIITGGPFFHFGIGNYLKKKGIVKKVLLDYRDPFSVNPRFEDSKLKIAIKKFVERKFLKGVDKILTVNKECHSLIAPKSKIQRAIIPNGYNEKYLSSEDYITPKQEGLVYPGKFYWQPTAFFELLEEKNLPLFHADASLAFEDDTLKLNNYRYSGYFKQEELQDFLNLGTIGLIFLNENPFESTTKIFDYIALNLKVLIITKGKKKVGAMQDILQDYPNVVWANNQKHEIAQAIDRLLIMKPKKYTPELFSRRKSYDLLIKEINNLF